MLRWISTWITAVILLSSNLLASEPFSLVESNPQAVQVTVHAEHQSIQAGVPFWIALRFQIDEHWHTYWKNPGEAGAPLSINWNLPPGFTVQDLQWPYPSVFRLEGITGYGYENEAVLLAKICPPKHILTEQVTLQAQLQWIVCSDQNCVPGTQEVSLTLPFTNKAASISSQNTELFTKARNCLPEMNWEAKAHRQNGFIHLHVKGPKEEAPHFQEAYFFPESSTTLNDCSDPIMTVLDQNLHHYSVVLKESENHIENLLKGVLVLKHPDPSLADKALSIELPIHESDREELAFVNPPLKSQTSINSASHADNDFHGSVALAILFAFVGGLILNLMPCVLPVISFKILGFVKMAGESLATTFKHGLAFSLGVLLSFWTLAGILISLQAYGRAVGWGFQLQEPIFVAALACILLVLGLSLFGVFEMGVSLTTVGGTQVAAKGGLFESFFSGILATAVATPCTGPFLGSAVGFAITLPPIAALSIFTSLGIGMAFPYLLLSACPRLLRFMPKPGNWMVTFKELMGFLMLATVLWLIWVYGAQTSSLAVFTLLCSFFCVAFACWSYGKWGTPFQSKKVRLAGRLVAAAALVLACFGVYQSSKIEAPLETSSSLQHAEDWETFSPERVEILQSQGIPVFIDFTAKWCLICQTNHLVLSAKEVEAKFKDKGVVRMKADWTRNDPIITEALKKFGRNSVPLYVLYGTSQEEPSLLPQVLTPETVLEALDKI